ncbi:hypothetical protein [Tenuibacillus multivorans]|uniref:Uncharacterized protein n=1 Tax=Tenuibacillus multivorans TaxID=237069 RepID=A0A1G9YNP0_9BACI|nr:hypothetical protein [Tenuibacillus multivorans]GEL78491.1 hypothetical protein TMU01_27260 [Tenuibacillus multivorans]SDN10788.1 hypothetical protein SAMN05216498_1495 [Tenuibacillus multivorans]
MSDKPDHQFEEELKSFPEYDMNPKKAEDIHDFLVQEANQLDRKDKRRMMMRRVTAGIASVAAILLIAIVSMNFMGDDVTQPSNNDQVNNQEETPNENGNGVTGQSEEPTDDHVSEEENELSDEEKIMAKAEEIISHLSNKKMNEIANTVHEEKGLLFSPYININEEAQVFDQTEIQNFLENTDVYQWGVQDGSGFPIEMTPGDYFDEYVYNKDYENADEVLYDEFKQRGNLKNNINEVFPESHIVEFHVKGEENEMNWDSLNLVFESNEQGEWKLVAVVHDQWTV